MLTPEEAQAIALSARGGDVPSRRAVFTPDGCAADRSALAAMEYRGDDSLASTVADGRRKAFLLLARSRGGTSRASPAGGAARESLVRDGAARAEWLERARELETQLRGPRLAPGLVPLREVAERAALLPWWEGVETILAPLLDGGQVSLAERIDLLAMTGEALCGEELWSREDGRALSAFVEELRLPARDVGTRLDLGELPAVLREAMDRVAVRPAYGGHSRVAIYGLLESRMTRADLFICRPRRTRVPASPLPTASWPQRCCARWACRGGFRIGLAAHDLAALWARARWASAGAARCRGPACEPLLAGVQALLGDTCCRASLKPRGRACPRLKRAVARRYPPRSRGHDPRRQRHVSVSVTALVACARTLNSLRTRSCS